MNYKIFPTREFEKDFNKLDEFFRKRIKSKVEEISENPERYKHLAYSLSGSCRIRVGKFRIIFSYSSELRELYLEKIIFSHRY